MPRTYTLYRADNPSKKYKVYVISHSGNIKKVEFGAYGMSDYTKHRDPLRKQRYLDRHSRRENWADHTTAGFWSRWVLWNLPTLNGSMKNTLHRFRLVPEKF